MSALHRRMVTRPHPPLHPRLPPVPTLLARTQRPARRRSRKALSLRQGRLRRDGALLDAGVRHARRRGKGEREEVRGQGGDSGDGDDSSADGAGEAGEGRRNQGAWVGPGAGQQVSLAAIEPGCPRTLPTHAASSIAASSTWALRKRTSSMSSGGLTIVAPTPARLAKMPWCRRYWGRDVAAARL